MHKKLTFIPILLIILAVNLSGQVTWPAISQQAKPWARWWWPGSIVSEKDLSEVLAGYADAGLGGLELTVLYGVKGQEDRFIDFLSPEWMSKFEYTLKEAEKLNIGIDLANSSSWPFGGPWVTGNDASKYLAVRKYSLAQGDTLKEPLVYIQEPYVRYNGTYRPDIKMIRDPVYENENLQLLAIDQIRFEKHLPLQALMAYSDNNKILDITDRVDDNGKLKWTAPEGNWTLYALFQGWHGKMVERAGPGGEGYVIDHFSNNAIRNYLDRFDKAFNGYDLSYLRGFFNDSYEVDDARGQSNWTPELFDEFEKRQGYDLRENLPALFQEDIPGKNAGVLFDYRQTISDLLLNSFTNKWTEWAHGRQKITRNQAHGSPANILDLYAATDIPETEGTEILRMKFGTSAANVTGKPLASAEASTWLGEHFSSTLLDVKKNVDQYFLAGVNHIVYHGTCYSPPDEPWPGFLFYAAVEFSPSNSFWNDFPILNNYVSRVQSFLQSGKPDNDILLYFPISDRFSSYNNMMIDHFDGLSPGFDNTYFKKGAEFLLDHGYSFDYFSDLQLKNSSNTGNLIMTEVDALYSTIVLPACNFIPIHTFNRMFNLAERGATIIVFDSLPAKVAGWGDVDYNTEIFEYLKEELVFTKTDEKGIMKAEIGSGRFLLGSDLGRLLEFAGVRREVMADKGLQFNRRKTLKGHSYFILNPSDSDFEGWIPLAVTAKSAILYNAMSFNSGYARTRTAGQGNTEVYVNLGPHESVIIQTERTRSSGINYSFYKEVSEGYDIGGTWSLEFIQGGPAIPQSRKIENTGSWTELAGDETKFFSGTAVYSIDFPKPKGKSDGWKLDLGKVCESARILLNGIEIAGLIGPDYWVIISKDQLKTTNLLEIRVSSLSANRIAWMDKNNIEWKKFYNTNYPSRLPENRKNGLFDASAWSPRESGLIGPVRIIPVKEVRER